MPENRLSSAQGDEDKPQIQRQTTKNGFKIDHIQSLQ